MRISFFSLIILSSCLLSLPISSHCDQVAQMLQFINSKGLPSSLGLDTDQLVASKLVSPPTSYICPQSGSKDTDKIAQLPGQPAGVDFNQYAGYVNVDQEGNHSLFYYFVESPDNSIKKPLVLWLNGGPGCSSLGYGGLEELGPFRVNSDNKTLSRNPFAWNNVANVIFLESPVGVGFSFSKNIGDYNFSGDAKTANDAYSFLINWFERFPEYKGKDFFIAGESYGGHYVPQLANKILQLNKEADNTIINLQGIAMGNALVDDVANNIGRFEFMYRLNLISDETYAWCRKACTPETLDSKNCSRAFSQAGEESGSLDGYEIFAPLCIHGSKKAKFGKNASWAGGIGMASYGPCSGEYVLSYLNLPGVQKALHARQGPWAACVLLGWIDRPPSVIPVIKEVIASGINVWMYSGDTDAVVPITSTRLSINGLQLPVTSPWHPWYSNKEVGGYVQQYKGLTFVSVRAAGHTVPTSQPERALTMFTSFIKGELPPAK